MDIRFGPAAWASLQALPRDIQSKRIAQLSWLANQQGPTFLDYRVTPFVLEPEGVYRFDGETYWVIYRLIGQEFLVINIGDHTSTPCR